MKDLRYDMGNAGDLLKHGVLAELIHWQCERNKKFRFFDLFAGKPLDDSISDNVKERVKALPTSLALRRAQTDIDRNHYYGSSFLAKKIGENVGKGEVRVLVNDRCEYRRKELKKYGLALLQEEPSLQIETYDGYEAFKQLACKMTEHDIVLLDPFSEFLPRKAKEIIPIMAEASKVATVILFALNWKPSNCVGKKFGQLLQKHLPKAWRMTFPPLPYIGIKGESKYYAEVVLAAREFHTKSSEEIYELRNQLKTLTRHLKKIPAAQKQEIDTSGLKLRTIGST